MCLVDIIKPYDSVNRTLLWTLLARFGVTPNIHTVIRYFQRGMRSRIRVDHGENSDWLRVGKVSRGGGVLASLLFNTFFAAVRHAVVERFCPNGNVVKDMVYTKEK